MAGNHRPRFPRSSRAVAQGPCYYFSNEGDQKAATAYCRACIDKCPGVMVSWYLITSYLYYILDVSLIEDDFFDAMCKRMLHEWDTLALKHPHRHLISLESLQAGTGFNLAESDYPKMVQGAAAGLAIEFGFVREATKRRTRKKAA